MRRLAVLTTVVAGMLAVAVIASGGVSARASRTTVRCDTDDLQAAIDAAPRNATLIIRGTCVGNFTIARDIRLRGFGPATLQGDGGTVLTIAEDAGVVLTDIVVTGGTADVRDDESHRVAGIYNAGFLKLDGSASVHENSEYHCGPNPPRGPCTPGYPFPVSRTGGIINAGRLMITGRASVRDNYGPGIFNIGTMTMRERSSVAGNFTLNSGGGVRNEGTLTMLDRASISDNRAIYRSSVGGGIYNAGTLVMSDRSSVHENEVAQNGGGVYNSGTMTLTDRASIRGNVSNFTGGGVWVSGLLLIKGRASITENEARGGGGIYVWAGGDVLGSLRGVTGNTPGDCDGCPAPADPPTAVPRTSTPVPVTRTAVPATRTVNPTAIATRAITPTARAADASATPTTVVPTATATAVPTPVLYMSAPRFQLAQKVGEPSLSTWTLGLPSFHGPNVPSATPDYTLMVWRLSFDRTLVDVVAFESQGMDCTFAWLDAAETQLEARCIPPAPNYLGEALTITTVCLKPYGRGTDFGAPWRFASGYVVDRGVEVDLAYIGANYTNSMSCAE